MLKISTLAAGYGQLAIGVLFNLGTVYFLKKSAGFTVFWPSFWALVTICITQWLVSRAMAAGIGMGVAVAIVVVCVTVGSILMGLFVFNEGVSPMKWAGLGLAVLGIVIATLS